MTPPLHLQVSRIDAARTVRKARNSPVLSWHHPPQPHFEAGSLQSTVMDLNWSSLSPLPGLEQKIAGDTPQVLCFRIVHFDNIAKACLPCNTLLSPPKFGHLEGRRMLVHRFGKFDNI
jgi:hypothetical protein